MPLLFAALASGANFLIGDSGISNPRTDISGILFVVLILDCKGTKKLRSKKENKENLNNVEHSVTVQRKVFLTILSQEFENESFFPLSSSLLGDRFVTH